MAVFSLDTVNDLNDIKQIKSYLYKLNEQLRYMFSNLDPDENYSEVARVAYVSDGERVSSLEVRADGIVMSVKELDETAAHKDSIISEINLSTEGIAISGNKINLNGSVAVNNSSGVTTVSIDPNTGTLTAVNANISGSITGANISGSLTLECGDEIKIHSATDTEDYDATLGGFWFHKQYGHDRFGSLDGADNFVVSRQGNLYAYRIQCKYFAMGADGTDIDDIEGDMEYLTDIVDDLVERVGDIEGDLELVWSAIDDLYDMV